MNNTEIKNLCISLISADKEKDVIDLLTKAGYWDNLNAWRYYGDYENNYNTIGNQQSKPDAALVEKIINSVDARLMERCLVNGIDPESSAAPQSVRDAVASFFDDASQSDSSLLGRIKHWSNAKRTDVARGITLCATGATPKEGFMSFTICDSGEGQTPSMMPETFLSLIRSNKLRIPFVQGKFNMGGTGVLKFCGHHNLQLVMSRRNPSILHPISDNETDNHWGFTVVRREDPSGGCRNSIYTYLAPLDCDKRPRKGNILSFSSDTMKIFPESNRPYVRECKWGTLIKLYEYAIAGYKSHILMKDGVLSRIDLLLPDVALPIRLHECRSAYSGHKGSFETTLTGLSVRLEDDKANNMETGFPTSARLRAGGQEMVTTIFAFKKGKADTYRKSEGIIFTLNGQTHGNLSIDFFRRKKVGLSYLSDSILLIVDCTNFDIRAREDLFMNSRDRLSGTELRYDIENALEDLLRNHDGLRELKEVRRKAEIESRLEDSKPLEDVLKQLLSKSPILADLFLFGKRVSSPFNTTKVKEKNKAFEGKTFPTYFKFANKKYSEVLNRECHINMRARVRFETDAASDYFSRDDNPGEFSLSMVEGTSSSSVSDSILNLDNGIATLSVKLPETCKVGDIKKFVVTVSDTTQIEPFINIFLLKILDKAAIGGKPGSKQKPPSDDKGDDREMPTGIQLPNIKKIHEDQWEEYKFDKYSAVKIVNAGMTSENKEDNDKSGVGKEIYDYYVNIDNVYLKSELKRGYTDPKISEARFVFGLVLLTLGILQQEIKDSDIVLHDEDEQSNDVNQNIEDKIAKISKGLAPIIIPMIESLGSLDVDDIPSTIGTSD